MALVSNIQLQDGSVKPPNLDTNLKYTAAGLTATEAIAVGTVPVSTSGSITVKSANDIRNWIQTTKTDGNVEIYMSNDARPDWALRVAGTADNAFVIANSYGSNCTAQFPAFSIGGAGAVGLGKTGATNILDIAYKNSATGGIQLTETQNSVGAKLIAEATSASIGSTSNHKLGFRVNGTTVAAFNTSTQFGIGTDSPGATLDVRGGAIFNEAGAAVDFRIEGDTAPHLFFVDGSTDAIGMKTANPISTSTLHIMGTDGDAASDHSGDAMVIVENCGTTFLELATGNANHAGLTFSDADTATRGAVLYDHGTGLGGAADSLYFQTAGSIRAVLQSDGDFGIGTLSPGADLHIAGVDDPEIRLQGAADGDPQINFYQSTTCRGTIKYKDTGDNFVMDSNGKVTLQTDSTPRLVITNAGCVGIGTNSVASACSTQLDIFSAGATTGLMLRTGNTSAASATIRGEGYRNDGDNEQVMQLVGRNSNNSIDLGIFEVAAETKHCEGKLELKTFDGSSMTTKMIIRADGNVGVGTATPAGKFHVEGSCAVFNPVSANAGKLEIVQGSTHADSIRLNATGTTNMYLEYRGYVGHQFVVNTTEGMRLTSTGLGIGTTVPAYKLESSCSSQSTSYPLALRNPDTSTCLSGVGILGGLGRTADSTIQYYAMMTLVKEQAWTGTGSTIKGSLLFSTPCNESGVERMRITSGGCVGIGTVTPAQKLHVHGGVTIQGSGDLCVGSPHFKVTSDGVVTWGDGVDNGVLTWDTGKAVVGGQSGHVLQLNAKGAARATVDDGFFGIGTASNSGFGGSCQQVIINGSDNARLEFGIGGSQLGGLYVANYVALYTSGNHFLSFQTCGTERMRILADGKVGIGTATPGDNLHIQADQPGIRFTDTAGSSDILVDAVGSNHGLYFRGDAATNHVILESNGDFKVDADTLFVDASENRVGIGTAAPATLLHLQSPSGIGKIQLSDDAGRKVEIQSPDSGVANGRIGTITNHSFEINAGAGGGSNHIGFFIDCSEKVRITSAGNVGIGTTAAAGRLQVCGNTVLNTTAVEGKLTVQDGNYGAAGEARSDVSYGTIALLGCSPTAGCVLPITFNMSAVGGRSRAAIAGVDLGSSGYCMGLAFYTRGAADGTAITTADEKMRILHNGNVGIGTTVPGAKLGINFNPALFNGLELTDSRGTNCRALFTQSGGLAGLYATDNGSYGTASITIGTANAGIATSAPCCTFHVYGDAATIGKGQGVNASAKLDLMSTSSAGYGGVLQGTTNNGVDWQVGHSKGVASSGFETMLRLQSTTGIIFGACNIGSTSVEHMFLCSNGVLGIGLRPLTTVFYEGSLTSKLQVAGTGGDSSITVLRQHALYGPTMILARNGGSPETNTLVDAGEGVGGVNFQANDGGKYVQVAAINVHAGDKAGSACMSGNIRFTLNGGSNGSLVERMRITQCGKVGIGTTTPSSNLHVIGSVGASTHMTAGNGIYFGVAPGAEFEPVRIDTQSNGGGTCTLYIGNQAIQTSSDRRVKNNIQCYTCSAVSVLDNARVVEFEYDKEKISDNNDFGPASRGKYVGLIAQEMIKYARWAINDGEGDPEGEHIWKAEYQHMVPLLIKAVQELNERIAELEAAA